MALRNKPKRLFQFSAIQDIAPLSKTITSLSASSLAQRDFDPECTHVIALKPSRSEKLIGACMTGAWFLKPAYVERSAKAKGWLPEGDFEWTASDSPDPQLDDLYNSPRKWRLHWQQTGKGPFSGWTLLFQSVSKSEKLEGLKRLCTLGGAQILTLNVSNAIAAAQTLSPHVFIIVDSSAPPSASVLNACVEQGIDCISMEYIPDHLVKKKPPSVNEYMLKKASKPRPKPQPTPQQPTLSLAPVPPLPPTPSSLIRSNSQRQTPAAVRAGGARSKPYAGTKPSPAAVVAPTAASQPPMLKKQSSDLPSFAEILLAPPPSLSTRSNSAASTPVASAAEPKPALQSARKSSGSDAFATPPQSFSRQELSLLTIPSTSKTVELSSSWRNDTPRGVFHAPYHSRFTPSPGHTSTVSSSRNIQLFSNASDLLQSPMYDTLQQSLDARFSSQPLFPADAAAPPMGPFAVAEQERRQRLRQRDVQQRLLKVVLIPLSARHISFLDNVCDEEVDTSTLVLVLDGLLSANRRPPLFACRKVLQSGLGEQVARALLVSHPRAPLLPTKSLTKHSSFTGTSLFALDVPGGTSMEAGDVELIQNAYAYLKRCVAAFQDVAQPLLHLLLMDEDEKARFEAQHRAREDDRADELRKVFTPTLSPSTPTASLSREHDALVLGTYKTEARCTRFWDKFVAIATIALELERQPPLLEVPKVKCHAHPHVHYAARLLLELLVDMLILDKQATPSEADREFQPSRSGSRKTKPQLTFGSLLEALIHFHGKTVVDTVPSLLAAAISLSVSRASALRAIKSDERAGSRGDAQKAEPFASPDSVGASSVHHGFASLQFLLHALVEALRSKPDLMQRLVALCVASYGSLPSYSVAEPTKAGALFLQLLGHPLLVSRVVELIFASKYDTAPGCLTSKQFQVFLGQSLTLRKIIDCYFLLVPLPASRSSAPPATPPVTVKSEDKDSRTTPTASARVPFRIASSNTPTSRPLTRSSTVPKSADSVASPSSPVAPASAALSAAKVTRGSQQRQKQQEVASPSRSSPSARIEPREKRNAKGETPLMLASKRKNGLEEVKRLLSLGANANAADHDNWTALHEAASRGFLETCRVLLQNGASVHAIGGERERITPLFDAVRSENVELVDLFVTQCDADCSFRNKDGQTAADVCRAMLKESEGGAASTTNLTAILHILEGAVAKPPAKRTLTRKATVTVTTTAKLAGPDEDADDVVFVSAVAPTVSPLAPELSREQIGSLTVHETEAYVFLLSVLVQAFLELHQSGSQRDSLLGGAEMKGVAACLDQLEVRLCSMTIGGALSPAAKVKLRLLRLMMLQCLG